MKDRLIEIIKQCACHYSPPCDGDCGLCNNVEMYDDQIEHIADAIIESDIIKCCHRQSEWISVDDRLPEDCGMPVLIVAVNSYNQMRIVKGFTDYQCPITFHTNEREYDGVWRAWEVTHWMPLPEPPKMKVGAE